MCMAPSWGTHRGVGFLDRLRRIKCKGKQNLHGISNGSWDDILVYKMSKGPYSSSPENEYIYIYIYGPEGPCTQ